MRLTLTLILFLLANVPAQAGGNCISKFECVDTCDWNDPNNPDIQTPSINYRFFYKQDGQWSDWHSASGPNTNCKDFYTVYRITLPHNRTNLLRRLL